MSAGYLSGIVQRARAAVSAPVAPSPARAPRRAVGPLAGQAPLGVEPRRRVSPATTRPATGGANRADAIERPPDLPPPSPGSALPPAPTRQGVTASFTRPAPPAPGLPSRRVTPPGREPSTDIPAVTVTAPARERDRPAALVVGPTSDEPLGGPGQDAPQRSRPARPATPSPFHGPRTSDGAAPAPAVAPIVEARPVVREEAPRPTPPDAPAVRTSSASSFRVRLPEEARSLGPPVRLEVERAVRRAARAELERRAPSGSGPFEITVRHVTVEVNAPPSLPAPPASAPVRPAPAATAPAPAGDGGFASLFLARNLSSW
jgi:hypothetical protein